MGGRTRATAGLCSVLLAALALTISACGGEEPRSVELAGLYDEYVSVGGADADTCRHLFLDDDGRFTVTARGLDSPHEDRRMEPAPAPVATGVWSFVDGRLSLEGDGWTATFEPDSTQVQLLARSDTVGSLRWVTSTGGSPFSACDLVSAAEFYEFLHPTEGSGSSGW
jgi:hypothetical protein